MRREPRRWRTRFGSFVARVGVPTLTQRLHSVGQPLTHKAVYNWLAGISSPRPETAEAMVTIARGAIRVADVYAHRRVVTSRPAALRLTPERAES